MKTSYFWKATHEPISDVKYVSISRSTPPGVQYMLSYESLMPSWDLVKLAHDQDFSQESFEYFRNLYRACTTCSGIVDIFVRLI